MENRESRRARELRENLAASFGLPEAVVGEALLAVAGAIHERLPRGVRVAFLSWVPECWTLLTDAANAPTAEVTPRGADALQDRVACAGVPPEDAGRFVAEMVRYLGEHCGRPLADALRRKVPEIVEIEQRAALVGHAPASAS